MQRRVVLLSRELTESQVDRQNILNNTYALKKTEELLPLGGYFWRKTYWFTKSDVATLFNVDIRTITLYLTNYEIELKNNGYHVLKGKDLKEFREYFAKEIDLPTKTTNLAVFNYRSVLNIAMLLAESEKAKEIRTKILDIVIDVLVEKTGGHTKYINQKDANYLDQSFKEETERKKFTNALNYYVEMNAYKYSYFTNEVYKAIFKENAQEYRGILNLSNREKIRETLYSEVLLLISCFEAGIAYEIENKYNELGRKLDKEEVNMIIKIFTNHPAQKPYLDDARTKMASRDLGFRDALHFNLESYVTPLNEEDYEKFLGEKSKDLELQIKEHREVFLRLRDK